MDRRGNVLRSAGLIAAGALTASILLAPAGAHVTSSFTHLFNQHIKPKLEAIEPRAYSVALTEDSAVDDDFSALGTYGRRIPRGKYAINAKVVAINVAPDTESQVTCKLQLGGTELDRTSTTMNQGIIKFDPIALQATGATSGAARVEVACMDNVGEATIHNLKITALRVAERSHVNIERNPQ